MSRAAWTILELLVVIAIVTLLLGLMLPAIQRARDAGWRTSCGNNLRQLGIALHGYHEASGRLPPGMSRKTTNFPYLAWSARILPHVEQPALWQATVQACAQQPSFFVDPPHIGLSTSLKVYLCPTENRLFGSRVPEVERAATTNYFGVSSGVVEYDGALFPESAIRFTDITDGTSFTLMVGERGVSVDGNGEVSLGWWYGGYGQRSDGSADYLLSVRELRTTFRTPTCPAQIYHFGPGRADNPCDLFHFWSRHLDGSHFLFVDGSVHYLSYSSDHLLPLLATRNGRETVELPD